MSDPMPSTNGAEPLTSALYLFCFARSPVTLANNAWGLETNQPLLECAVGDVAAIYSLADPSAFNGPGSDERLRDIAWVGPLAVRHQQVVEEVMCTSPVLPCRFGTLFSSPEVLTQLLEGVGSTISPFLDYITDKEEWSVKGLINRAQADEWMLRSKPEFVTRREQLPESPGKRYFLEKKLSTDIRSESLRQMAELMVIIQKTLNVWAHSSHSMRFTATTESDTEMIFNESLLVSKSRIPDLVIAVAQLNRRHEARGLALELSGPWPPYSFSPSFD